MKLLRRSNRCGRWAAARRLSREVGEKTAVQKVIDLADVQVWALWEATDRFRLGDVGEGALKPKTGQAAEGSATAREAFRR